MLKWSYGELLLQQPNFQSNPDDKIFDIADVHNVMSAQLFKDVLAALEAQHDQIRNQSMKRRARMVKECWQMMAFFRKHVEDNDLVGSSAGSFFSQIFNVLPTGGVGEKPCGLATQSNQSEFVRGLLKELLRSAKIVSLSDAKLGLREGTALMDRTASGISSSLLLEPNTDGRNLKDTGKNRLLWVAHWERLGKFVRGNLECCVGRIGQVVLVKSVSTWKVSFSPPLDLNEFGVDASGPRHRVAVLEMANIHPWINMFACFRIGMRGVPRDFSLCLAYLGFWSSEIQLPSGDELYGNYASRREFVEHELPNCYTITLTKAQADLIYNLGVLISVWDLIAGFGKSMLLAITAFMFHRKTEPTCPDRIAYVVAPTHETCADLAQTLSKFFSKREVLQIRVVEEVDAEATSFVDLAQTWVDLIAQDDLSDEFAFLSIIDVCIHALSGQQRNCVHQALPVSIYRAVTALFAVRHCFLHMVLYAELAASRRAALKAVKVVVCTIEGRVKLKGKLSPWPKMLGERKYEIVLIDEMESVGKMQAGACLVGAHGAILSGDENQDLGRKSMTRQTGASGISMGSSENVNQYNEDKWYMRPDPLHFLPVPEWASSLKAAAPDGVIKIHKGFETRRLGNDVVLLLRYLFPYLEENNLISLPGAPNTMICPVFVDPNASDWQYAARNETGSRQEVTKSLLFFKIALAIVALEVVLLVHSSEESQRERGNILVMWSLARPLKEFESFLTENFTKSCVAMHTSLGFPWTDMVEEKYAVGQWLTRRVENDL